MSDISETKANEKEQQLKVEQPIKESAKENRTTGALGIAEKYKTVPCDSVGNVSNHSFGLNDAKPVKEKEQISEHLTIEDVTDEYSSKDNEQECVKSQHATKTRTINQPLDVLTKVTSDQAGYETFGSDNKKQATEIRIPLEAAGIESVSFLHKNQNISEGKVDKSKAKIDLEPVQDRSYNVVEMKATEKEALFEQKQSKHEQANMSRAAKPQNVVTKKKTDASESVLPANIVSHIKSEVKSSTVQEEMKEPITIEEVSDSISTESNEQTVLENKHATKSEKLKGHISIETSLADGQTKSETYGRRKLEKVTVSKAPQEAIETMCTSMSQENQVVDEVKSERRNANLDLEPILDRSYTVDEMTSNEKEEQFEQKQPKQEKANKKQRL